MKRLHRAGLAMTALALFGSAAFACSSSDEPASAPDDAGAAVVTTRRDAGAEAATPPPRDTTNAVVVDLGLVAPGQEVSLDVPPNALGFNVVLQGSATGKATIGIERITSPSGEVVHAAYMPTGGSHQTSVSSFGEISAAAVPQSEAKSANPPEAGKWKIRFGDGTVTPDGGAPDAGTSATLRASAIVQIGSPAGFVGGRLDLDVWVPDGLALGGEELDAKKAETDPEVAFRLDVFFTALATQLGIDRGAVTFRAAPSHLTFVGSGEQLVDGFSASTGQKDDQRLHLVLTNAIDFGGGSAAWGIAPGIPGAVGRAGTSMSGIILAVGDTPATGDGLTILHEAGHFIGLNHTTELADGFADPLSDTPKCEGISIDDPSTIFACPDKRNIMFPSFYGSGATFQISPAQIRIFRSSPIHRAYADGELGTMSGTMTAMRTMAAPASLSRLSPLSARTTFTKSGRALSPTETFLLATSCPHGAASSRVDARAAFARRGAEGLAELRAIAADTDLPSVLRRRAAGLATSLAP